MSEKIRDELVAAGVRVEWDNRTNYNPGWKYAHWEQRGVPLRLEIGARDLAKGSVVLVRRDTGEKASIAIDEVAGALVGEDGLLNTIHNAMLAKARAERDSRLGIAYTWDEFMVELTKVHFTYFSFFLPFNNPSSTNLLALLTYFTVLAIHFTLLRATWSSRRGARCRTRRSG